MEGERGLWHDVPCAGSEYEDVLIVSDQNG